MLASHLPALFVFLPRGKGALILMLGGLLMVTFSLLWLMARPRAAPILSMEPSRIRRPDPAGHAEIAPGIDGRGDDHRAQHLRHVRRLAATAKRAGLRRIQVVMAGPERGLVLLTACPTCRRLGAHAGGCEPERRRLEVAARTEAAGARVIEISCNLMGTGACIFEVSTGAVP